MKAVFWDISPCRLVDTDIRFGVPTCHHHHKLVVFFCHRTSTCGGWGIYWLVERQSASQEGHCSMKLCRNWWYWTRQTPHCSECFCLSRKFRLWFSVVQKWILVPALAALRVVAENWYFLEHVWDFVCLAGLTATPNLTWDALLTFSALSGDRASFSSVMNIPCSVP